MKAGIYKFSQKPLGASSQRFLVTLDRALQMLISRGLLIQRGCSSFGYQTPGVMFNVDPQIDRKSTRLNSSHVAISYAVFCLKKKRTAVSATTKTGGGSDG